MSQRNGGMISQEIKSNQIYVNCHIKEETIRYNFNQGDIGEGLNCIQHNNSKIFKSYFEYVNNGKAVAPI